MGSLRTLLLVIMGHAVFAPAQTAHAQSLPQDPAFRFAKCSGRLSALMEHQWLMQDAGADHTQLLRDAMVELMEAAASPDQAAILMQHRIAAKSVLSQVLDMAEFSQDAHMSRKAGQRGAVMITDCANLLLIALRS